MIHRLSRILNHMPSVTSRPPIDISHLTHRLKNEGMEGITVVYKRYRDEFLGFAQKYVPKASRELLLSVWHDTMISFYEILMANRFDPQRSSLKTFLFSIGKHKLMKAVKKEARSSFVPLEESRFLDEAIVSNPYERELTERESNLKRALQKMGEKCRQLLRLTYYHQYSSEAIQEEMSYTNANVVYSHKSRCLKQLRGIMMENV